MLRRSSVFFLASKKNNSNNLLGQLQPLLEGATTIQNKIRGGMLMAEDMDFRVLRIGYDEDFIKKALSSSNNITNYKMKDFVSYNENIKPDSRIFRLLNNSHSTGRRNNTCSAICHLPFNKRMLRPGGSSNGPSMMMIADATMFAVSYSLVGQPLAVTTNLQINFFRKPMAGEEIFAVARLMKNGKRLHVFEVDIVAVNKDLLDHLDEDSNKKVVPSTEDNDDEQEDLVKLVAHSTGTYSIPVVKS